MLMIDARIALKSLRATKVRTALTILGVVIGVASITIVLSLGEGAKSTIQSQVNQLGHDVLTIRSGKGTRDNTGTLTGYNFWAALGSSTISEYDLQTLQQMPQVKLASPIMAITGSVRSDQTSEPVKNTNIIATNSSFDTVADLKVHSGDFLDPSADRNTVVLGQDLAIQMLGSDTAIGHTVFIRGQPFTVIGILSKYNIPTNLSDLYDYNRTAFITMDAGKEFNQGVAQIQQINLRVDNEKNIKSDATAVHNALLKNHENEEDFVVLRPEETLTFTNAVLKVATQFSSALASVSLIVGGIGIMNIMLVSVTERTREIGIRKAVGATNAQILRQFLMESLAMSIIGGILGTALAYLGAFIIGSFFHITPIITLQVFGLAMLVAVVVGVAFGITPALKAAKKDPIEALRIVQ